MKRFILIMAAVAACLFSAFISAADLAPTWWSFNVFALKVPMVLPPPLENSKVYISWKGRGKLLPTAASSADDLILDAELYDGQTTHAGSIMLISSRAMAIKGPFFTNESNGKADFEGAVGVAMNAMASERLVLQMLSAALPQGPDNLKGEQAMDYTETKTALPTASPPWKLTGTVKRDADGSVDYDLTLITYVPGHPDVARKRQFVGSFSKVASTGIPDGTSLQGWTLNDMGTKLRVPGAGTAAHSAAAYQTVGDVRAALRVQRH